MGTRFFFDLKGRALAGAPLPRRYVEVELGNGYAVATLYRRAEPEPVAERALVVTAGGATVIDQSGGRTYQLPLTPALRRLIDGSVPGAESVEEVLSLLLPRR